MNVIKSAGHSLAVGWRFYRPAWGPVFPDRPDLAVLYVLAAGWILSTIALASMTVPAIRNAGRTASPRE